jgi:quinohemoprotein ethanol dehydrogenase
MTRLSRSIRTVLVLGALAMPAAVYVQQPDEDGRLVPAKDWPLVGGDWTSARYSSLKQIDTGNVRNLAGAWMKRFNAAGSTRATPVVKDGVLFIPAGPQVYAINAATGQTVWTWPSTEPDSGRTVRSPMESIDGEELPNVAGAALGEGLVFVGLRDGRVVALDQKTGKLAWAEPIGETPRKKGESVSGAPTYARGTVFAGLANGDWAMRGRVVALDARTGKKRWTFATVPGPGEFGHDTWPANSDTWMHGGAGVWLVGTVDADLGLVFFSTGNAVPMYGGEIRKGDNLFTASILALDIATGKRRWHYQVVHHDLWDADIATPPVLYDAAVNGTRRKALAALRADGYFFFFDRETGKPIHPVEERRVTQDPFLNTAARQPFPVGAESILPGCGAYKDKIPPPFELDCSGFSPPSLNKHTVVGPGMPIPRVRVTPMSYSPQTGYFYAQGTGAVGRARRISDDPWFQETGAGSVVLPRPVGIIAAVDSRTNTVVWKKEVPAPLLGGSGPLTTAGGLMFRAAADGNVEAYDAKTGAELWQFQTGVRTARGPAVTYEAGGDQYVALAMGTVMWAFKLGGSLKPVPPLAVAPSADGRLTQEIETGTMMQVPFGGAVGNRYATDEHAFNPQRARVKSGTRVMFVNNGRLTHTLAADDGSWKSGLLGPARSFYVTFDKRGTYQYHCTDHPWAIGLVTVEP